MAQKKFEDLNLKDALFYNPTYRGVGLDISSIKPGNDFAVLKPGYVIFICDVDPFGKG